MQLTRRRFAASSAALASSGPIISRAPSEPIVIAHRGASGERPEHTLMAYRLAVDEGADFIEPDLVVTKDGHLVVRHENEIAGTTDVAGRPEFAARKTAKIIDGQKVEGWFAEDFTLAEIKTLRARERLPAVRTGSAVYDGREAIATFQEVIDLAKAQSRRLDRPVGIYPEMKHPSFLASVGLPIDRLLAAALKANGLDSREAKVFVQCFEPGPLKAFRDLSKARRVQLVGAGDPQMVSAEGLKAIAAYADGVGPDWSLVIPTAGGVLGAPTALVADAHAAGLVVHPWTVRAENMFLPTALRRGAAPAEQGEVAKLFRALYAAGIDGVFSDFPRLAVAARGA